MSMSGRAQYKYQIQLGEGKPSKVLMMMALRDYALRGKPCGYAVWTLTSTRLSICIHTVPQPHWKCMMWYAGQLLSCVSCICGRCMKLTASMLDVFPDLSFGMCGYRKTCFLRTYVKNANPTSVCWRCDMCWTCVQCRWLHVGRESCLRSKGGSCLKDVVEDRPVRVPSVVGTCGNSIISPFGVAARCCLYVAPKNAIAPDCSLFHRIHPSLGVCRRA